MAPAPKKAKTSGEEKAEEAAEEPKEAGDAKEDEPNEPEPPKELEGDAKADKAPKLKEPVAFHTEDTTMNCMPSAFGNMLVPLTDGGLQYLLAGARASVGLKAGRYMFEAKLMEVMNPADDPAARSRAPMPRNQFRVGFSTSGSSLFLGDGEESICFDADGALVHNKKKEAVSGKFGSGDVVAVLLNLDSSSQNENTISLFKNGERACQPQALPEALKGKPLFPTLTFKNVTVHYNFGPAPIRPLPFTCRMVQDASIRDAQAVHPNKPKDGKFEVLFPVCLPDEGSFDWLDLFLEKHKQYTELSDRAIIAWAEKSGFSRPKVATTKGSNDKPESGLGVSMMDDGSVRRVLTAVAPIQQRNYVVMEVKSALVKEERKELLGKWSSSSFKRTAAIMMGEPPADLKKHSQDLTLKAKQDVADAEFRAKKAEEKRKKMLEKRQKQLERERKKAEKAAKKKQEALKKKLEEEKRKKERAEKGEPEEEEQEETKEEAKAEEKDSDDDEKEDEEMEESEEQPPQMELTAEEKKLWFRKTPIPDLAPYTLNTTFMKFSTPEKEEGFDEVRFEWTKGDKCREYLKQWVRERKLTTRIEDLQPSDWFANKWKDWQKTLQAWHTKQNQYKTAVAKKASDAAAKAAAKEAKKKAAEAAAAKAKAAKAKAEAEKAEKEGEDGKEEGGEEKKEEDVVMEAPEEEEKEEKEEAPAVDFEKLDVFGVEDILDIGGGQPLFSAFNFEDWTMMSLRFELHLLTHAFRKDANDPDRVGIHLEHLAFYYNKYFKKALNTKFYGVDSMKELLEYVRDTVVVSGKGQVVETLLPEEMESAGVFVMLTEEARRDRTRRVSLGEEAARLKISQAGAGAAVAGGARPGAPAAAGVVRPAGAAAWPRPAAAAYANGAAVGFRPPNAFQQQRPYQQPAWRGYGR